MPVPLLVAGVGAAAAVGGAAIQANQASKAAKAQNNAIRDAANAQNQAEQKAINEANAQSRTAMILSAQRDQLNAVLQLRALQSQQGFGLPPVTVYAPQPRRGGGGIVGRINQLLDDLVHG